MADDINKRLAELEQKFGKQKDPSTAGAIAGSAVGTLGSLLTLKSQRDIINQEQANRGAALAASRQAAADIGRNVVSAGASQGGALGLQQGLQAADGLQRRALAGVQQANLQDQARADAFAGEQRQRKERLGAGIGAALGAAGATLGTAFSQGDGSAGVDTGSAVQSALSRIGGAPGATDAGSAVGIAGSGTKMADPGIEPALQGIGLRPDGNTAQSNMAELGMTPLAAGQKPAASPVSRDLLAAVTGSTIEDDPIAAIAVNNNIHPDNLARLRLQHSDEELMEIIQRPGGGALLAQMASLTDIRTNES